MIEQIQTKLDRINEKDQGKPRKKIAILGAGMAGLVAAYELDRLGHQVIVYEANKDRVGGRAWTHRFEDGQYHELGAMRFPKEHDYTRYYANLCGLTFRTFINHHDDDDAMYYFRGISCKHSEWETHLLPELQLTEFEKWMIHNGPIPAAAKGKQLLNLLVYPMEQAIHEITSNPFDLDALLGQGPLTDRVEELDSLSMGDYLRKFITSTDGLALIGAVTGLEVWWDKAVTMFVREEVAIAERLKDQGIENSGIEEIVGGTDLLPSGMLHLLSQSNVEVKMRHKVEAIEKKNQTINLQINGKILTYDYVICTLPFSILRQLTIIGLTPPKMSAIRNMNYASSTKVLLNTKNRFWESNYAIKGGGSQMDLINRQIYYPSDNVSAKEKGFISISSIHGAVQQFDSKELSDPDACNNPGVIVGSYCWGQDARRLAPLSNEERTNVIVEAVSNIHPELLEKGMVKDSASISWDQYRFSSGAFCFMKPGDFTHYYYDAIRPEGKLYFAGEHCSLDNGWIQGSLISTLNAVEQLIDN